MEPIGPRVRHSFVVHGSGLVAVALSAALALVACDSADQPRTAPGAPALERTEWRVISLRTPHAEPTRVTVGARFRMDGAGRASADACNHIGAGYHLNGDKISFTPGGTTLAACTGQRHALDDAFVDLFKGDATWGIADRRLTMSNGRGWRLVLRRAASVFPRGHGTVVLSGRRGAGAYQLSVTRHGRIWGADYAFRLAPGTEQWSAGIASDDIACLANSVTQASWPDGTTFVFGWVTPQVARVVSSGVTFTFHDVPGTDLRIAAAWVRGFRPRRTTISWYDASGAALASYPDGPC